MRTTVHHRDEVPGALGKGMNEACLSHFENRMLILRENRSAPPQLTAPSRPANVYSPIQTGHLSRLAPVSEQLEQRCGTNWLGDMLIDTRLPRRLAGFFMAVTGHGNQEG